ncbi:MAG TPA: LexA family transcriptional regulator [Ferruginibacter sp.]|jgi:transcriptional regulator with XRE-family HTH domain|nr:LexA family transcriptional regulator [Ferruginibacter sp.]HRO05632.1 LexA family transcriptional regulator [Ferruginibacter sp.]HRO95804.1 LexA family transcriptional regulator [Ferruginibacter sp.]HRP49187.1 LexA family transcriptional regulator [Ferruginibacter sp.]
MSQAGLNLKYLRKLRGWTQEEFAQKLNVKRSLIGAYEEERADPRLEVLEMVSEMFKVSLDELLLKDLSENQSSYWMKRRNQKLGTTTKNNLIHFVPVKAAAGYLAGYADTEFIEELNTFTLPMLSGGHYRAFEIIGDSMLPTPSGSIIVGEKINNLDDLKSNTPCIVVSMQEGIVYKRVVKNNRSKNKLTLVSDNPAYQPYQVNTEDVAEIWMAQMIIGKVADQQRWDVNTLANLVNNLQDQVSSLSKKMN